MGRNGNWWMCSCLRCGGGGVLIDTQISGNGFYFGSYQVVSQIVGPSFAINNFDIIKLSSWSVLGQY